MLVVYANVCAPCKYRQQLRLVNRYARAISTRVKIVETFNSLQLREEARTLSDVQMPFLYNTETCSSMRLTDVKEGFRI